MQIRDGPAAVIPLFLQEMESAKLPLSGSWNIELDGKAAGEPGKSEDLPERIMDLLADQGDLVNICG